jgi:dihydrodipicolinate synthase/N-acetylneuraminate lyase
MTSNYYVPKRPFNDGVYCPLTTAMTEDGQVNLEALNKQVVRLANAGMGIVLLGTNGEGECQSSSTLRLVSSPC